MPPSRVVDSVRRFNRFYTRRIGVLQRQLLGSPFSLTEVRVLYELAHQAAPTAAELQAQLGLDAGYLSRMLRDFARRRLIKREPSVADGRKVHLQLTQHGREVFGKLNDESARQIAGLIKHLSAPDQERLTAAMRTVEHLLHTPAEPRPAVALRAPKPGDLGWVVQRHGALYAQEYGWDLTFEALVARIVADFGQQHDSTRERCWIADQAGTRVGCIFLVRESDTVAKLRLLLVEPSARGAGVGRDLVQACIRFARTAGYLRVTLWTNSVLQGARRLYESAGFRLVRVEKHHSFGQDLEGQYWELPLA